MNFMSTCEFCGHDPKSWTRLVWEMHKLLLTLQDVKKMTWGIDEQQSGPEHRFFWDHHKILLRITSRIVEDKQIQEPQEGPFKYLVSYGGGQGPDVWDADMIIHTDNILKAAEIATERAEHAGGWVFMISQEDYPISSRQQLEERVLELRRLLQETRNQLEEASELLQASAVPFDKAAMIVKKLSDPTASLVNEKKS